MSIEGDIFVNLKNDATLLALLGGSSSDYRIYQLEAPQEKTPPYIVIQNVSIGGTDLIIDDLRVAIKIFTANGAYTLANSIRDRVTTVLDQKDTLTSPDNYIYWCKRNGGGDIVDKDTGNYIKVVYFDIRFQKKSR